MTRFILIPATFAAAALFYAYPPETTAFYPRCPIYAITGILCPGCGATRALSLLLHAHWHQAWQSNSLIIALLPVVLAYAFVTLIKSTPPPIPPILTYALFLITTLFTIARN